MMENEQEPLQLISPYNLIQIVGEINEKTALFVTEALLMYDYNNGLGGNQQPIHLLINSGGGRVDAAWQICDIMDCIETPVHTIGVGNIASAALMIFINGERGNRVLSKRSSVMSHQYSWGVEGKYSDLKAAQSEIDNIYKRMSEFFCEKTQLDKAIVEKEILEQSDRWLTASQAKKYNLADKVLDFYKSSPFKLIKSLRASEVRKQMIQDRDNLDLIRQSLESMRQEEDQPEDAIGANNGE